LCAIDPTQVQLSKALLGIGWLVPKLGSGVRRDFKTENLNKLSMFWPGFRAHEPQLPGTLTFVYASCCQLGH
jgi:hypothetical protein